MDIDVQVDDRKPGKYSIRHNQTGREQHFVIGPQGELVIDPKETSQGTDEEFAASRKAIEFLQTLEKDADLK